ncbi:MAG TPA: glutathione S-transferase [Methylophilaceae bacterium]|nr:glutathione S-transferase [Methylophilaceae bacterium]
MALPILYSYRRCPYAMRARMALHYAGVGTEIREIVLRNKPQHMLQISPKATVPVLLLPDGEVIDESQDIMRWALAQRDSEDWLLKEDTGLKQQAIALIAENDSEFKQALDRYKYAIRFPENSPEFYRVQGELFLQKLEQCLNNTAYFCRNTRCIADIAIFPFIRQFAAVDEAWFATAPYPKLRAWLNVLIQSELFLNVMQKHPVWQD